MSKIDLSVIVACYNIENYLRPCLDSIANTYFPKSNMEVLMVDDGSTDHTKNIVDEYDHKFSNFKAIHEHNGGPSVARNTGMDHASGKYVAFVDGDDIVPPNAYSDLMYVAISKNSDMVTGFVHRFNNLQNKGSYLHSLAIKENLYNITLDQDHDLLYDTTSWNKVYRLSFLRKNNIRFIPRMIYEDLPFTLNVLVKSKRLSVIKDVVYWWRCRPNSITESRDTFSNFLSRIKSDNICRQILFDVGYTYKSSLFKDVERKILLIDLNVYLHNIGDSDESYIYKVQELTYLFLRDWHLLHSPLFKTIHIKAQILYYAIETGNLELLKQFTHTNPKSIGEFKVSPITKHYSFKMPEVSASIAKHMDVRSNVLNITQAINRIHVDPVLHFIYGNGMFKIHNMPLFKKRFSNNNYHDKISAALVNLNNHRTMAIHFVRRKTPGYKRVLRPRTAWTNSRYDFSFNYDDAIKKLGSGLWFIQANEVVDNRYYVSAYLSSPVKANLKHDLFNPLKSKNHFISDDFNTNSELMFKVEPLSVVGAKDTNWVDKPQWSHQHLIFTAGLVHPKSVIPVIRCESRKVNLRGSIKSNGSHYYLIFNVKSWHHWNLNYPSSLYLIHKRTNHLIDYQFLYNSSLQDLKIDNKCQAIISYHSRQAIQVFLNHRPLIITKCKLINQRYIDVFAKFQGKLDSEQTNFHAAKIILLTKHLANRYILSADEDKVKFNRRGIKFQIPLLTKDYRQLKILSGKYQITLCLPINRRIFTFKFVLSPKLIMDGYKILPIKTSDIVKYRNYNNNYGFWTLRIKQPNYGFSRKRSHRALSYSLLYPLMRLLPIRNVMVFDSYWAHQFSSNERAMYNYMQRYHPNIKTVWFFHNRLTPITGNGKRVKVNTLEYWYYLATARFLIQNTNLPNQYYKRSGQIEVETLHGTFLKHMGFDQPSFRTATQWVQNRFARRNRRWDYMVVPSEYMRKIASRAFDYHQHILPYGFPRTDNLVKNDNKSYIKSIKLKLGIPLNKKVILYAPTFRGNDPFNFQLNLKRMKEQLSNEYVLLIRLHYFVAHTHTFYKYPGFIYDVSDYSNINDLFLISDVLVTDYSSVMFDYSYLKRPIIYYAYDKDYYLDNNNRGVYLNYESDMPGPIVKTQTELMNALKHLDEINHKYHQKIINFSNKFAQYGKRGNATQNVVETILHTSKKELDQQPDKHVIFNKFWHWFRIKNFRDNLMNYLGQTLPKRDIIIFDSFFGEQYSDSPKALYLYIKKHYPKYKLYWLSDEDNVSYFKNHHIHYINQESYHGIFAQAQAKYWIINGRFPLDWQVPRGTEVLQTWHGTPLKKIGHDVDNVTMPGTNVQKYTRRFYEDDCRWDYLLVPNMYSERIMGSAFRKNASQMMLTGSPKDDVLVNASSSRIKRIKERLGIPDDKIVILYAPTWRDNEFIKTGEYIARLHLDLDKFRKHYGHKVVILIRSHYMISNHLDLSKYRDVAINVSDYQDIADLYLISNILITDYSSAMFDYAILKRPMIFYDYDYDKYTKDVRGLYFNFKELAPGPIAFTTDQVINQLDEILAGHWKMNKNYRHLISKFTKWDDGHATERAVQQLFSGRNVQNHYFTRQTLGLPKVVQLKDGASMWKSNKDFKNRFDVNFYQNYDDDQERFRVIKGLQLESTDFNKLIGMRYVLIENSNYNQPVWVNINDIIK